MYTGFRLRISKVLTNVTRVVPKIYTTKIRRFSNQRKRLSCKDDSGRYLFQIPFWFRQTHNLPPKITTSLIKKNSDVKVEEVSKGSCKVVYKIKRTSSPLKMKRKTRSFKIKKLEDNPPVLVEKRKIRIKAKRGIVKPKKGRKVHVLIKGEQMAIIDKPVTESSNDNNIFEKAFGKRYLSIVDDVGKTSKTEKLKSIKVKKFVHVPQTIKKIFKTSKINSETKDVKKVQDVVKSYLAKKENVKLITKNKKKNDIVIKVESNPIQLTKRELLFSGEAPVSEIKTKPNEIKVKKLIVAKVKEKSIKPEIKQEIAKVKPDRELNLDSPYVCSFGEKTKVDKVIKAKIDSSYASYEPITRRSPICFEFDPKDKNKKVVEKQTIINEPKDKNKKMVDKLINRNEPRLITHNKKEPVFKNTGHTGIAKIYSEIDVSGEVSKEVAKSSFDFYRLRKSPSQRIADMQKIEAGKRKKKLKKKRKVEKIKKIEKEMTDIFTQWGTTRKEFVETSAPLKYEPYDPAYPENPVQNVDPNLGRRQVNDTRSSNWEALNQQKRMSGSEEKATSWEVNPRKDEINIKRTSGWEAFQKPLQVDNIKVNPAIDDGINLEKTSGWHAFQQERQGASREVIRQQRDIKTRSSEEMRDKKMSGWDAYQKGLIVNSRRKKLSLSNLTNSLKQESVLVPFNKIMKKSKIKSWSKESENNFENIVRKPKEKSIFRSMINFSKHLSLFFKTLKRQLDIQTFAYTHKKPLNLQQIELKKIYSKTNKPHFTLRLSTTKKKKKGKVGRGFHKKPLLPKTKLFLKKRPAKRKPIITNNERLLAHGTIPGKNPAMSYSEVLSDLVYNKRNDK